MNTAASFVDLCFCRALASCPRLSSGHTVFGDVIPDEYTRSTTNAYLTGPGRGCRTRLETGAGVPQLQAIREAWCAVEDTVPIIADGGVREDKDVFLALVAGASVVMLGSMLSGTDEAPGQIIEDPGSGEKRKIYRGMTSPQAVFRALYDDEGPDALEAALEVPAEGQEMQVPYRGSVVDILRRIRGHLRSAVSYGGSESLAQLREKVLQDPLRYLVPLSSASRVESYER